MDIYMEQMKADYDQLVDGLDASYKKLDLYVDLRKAKKNEILKKTSSVESCSRYLCSGFVGLFQEGEERDILTEIFMTSDVAFDSESYLNASRTDFYLKCLSDIIFIELSKKAESQVIENHPKFVKLGLAINHRMLSRQGERSRIKNLGISRGYPEFVNALPGIEKLLTQSELASYFNCTDRTVRSVLKEYKSKQK
ncbi:hypothetical protein SYJ56_24495 [Algoriphagus sp. D3-2-R+10]|uniref:hypothetical protein n=1 Tax=Algoriphagus aurantiacus TaxID=3103948 RepID=UPI002B3D757B|nr:hypothetical protein [Algoriphagus sp. D3-2-R+10]MEB2778491.1 hypothetical protein [Algoriphagus sp. D3-2-R+10]